ncbi:MAG: GDSL-type esterase/lipase family protein [Bacteroidota bacterium]|nr:GDSL-type esterase/lipase family protein [Bacteroidota bacterium]
MKQGSEAIKVVVFGGTVTEGTSAKLDVSQDCFKWGTTEVNMVRKTQTWGAIIERILRDWVDGGVEVISAGSAGNTAADGADRLEDDVLSHSPDYVLVMFGMDDALAGVEADKFREDLKKIVTRIEEEKVNVVLITPPPISERMTINCTMDELRQRQAHLTRLVQVIRNLAKEKSLPLIDFHQYFLGNRLAYDHLFEGWLPDAVAQTAMAPFAAGKLLPVMGVDNYPNPTLGDYRKAYSDSKKRLTKHNGFTDLTYFNGEFYLAFRSGAIHGFRGLLGGKTLVLKSSDGIIWTKDAELKVDGFVETRDPKFLHVEDKLFVYPVCHAFPESGHVAEHYGFERIGAGNWGEPFKCAPRVLWRPKKWGDKYVAAGYEWKFDEQRKRYFRVGLYQSQDGREWKKVSTIIDYGKGANETEFFVENDKLIAYSRTQEGGNGEMHVSTYIPDENRWETVSTGRLIHGPCIFQAEDRTFITGRYCSQGDDRFRELQGDWKKFTNYVQQPDEEGYKTVAEAAGIDPARIEEYHHGLRTGIFFIEGARLRLVMELLSAGDSSYPGVVKYGDEYVISDYSMHEYYPVIRKPGDWETPSDIYVSRVRFGH